MLSQNWREKKFSFVQYPFVLDPAYKAQILQVSCAPRVCCHPSLRLVKRALFLHCRSEQHDATWQMRETVQESMAMMLMRPNPYLVLEVRRAHLIENTLSQVPMQHLHCLPSAWSESFSCCCLSNVFRTLPVSAFTVSGN